LSEQPQSYPRLALYLGRLLYVSSAWDHHNRRGCARAFDGAIQLDAARLCQFQRR
jgi:hypothetical protein